MPVPLLAIGLGLLGAGTLAVSQADLFAPAPPTGLAFGQKVSPAFRRKVTEVGKRLQIDPSYLMSIMMAESGLKHSIHITPVGKTATGGITYKRSTDPNDVTDKTIGGGLIGFMRGTAKGLGTDLKTLLSMSAVDQLDYVEKFYQLHRKSGVLPPNPSLRRVYMATFYPAKAYLADKPDAVLFSRDSPVAKERKAYIYNESTDRNHDGVTTIGEAMSRIDGIYKRGLKDENRY